MRRAALNRADKTRDGNAQGGERRGEKPAAQTDEKIDLTGLIPPDKGKTMSAAYQSGVLPAPAAPPDGTVEEQAFFSPKPLTGAMKTRRRL